MDKRTEKRDEGRNCNCFKFESEDLEEYNFFMRLEKNEAGSIHYFNQLKISSIRSALVPISYRFEIPQTPVVLYSSISLTA